MAEQTAPWRSPRFWITLVVIVILLIFLYFFKPFEAYLVEAVPNIRFDNVVFWFASLVGVVAFAFAHWQSFRRNIWGSGGLQVEALAFDTLQTTLLTAVIFSTGAALQALEMLAEHLVQDGGVVTREFGGKLLSIIVLLLLTFGFYLLHLLVRAFRHGWQPRRRHPGATQRS